jgi:hypothetical protein
VFCNTAGITVCHIGGRFQQLFFFIDSYFTELHIKIKLRLQFFLQEI